MMNRPPVPHRLQRPDRKARLTSGRWSRLKARVMAMRQSLSRVASALFLFLAGSHRQEVERLPLAEIRAMKVEGAMLFLSGTLIAMAGMAAAIIGGVPWFAAPFVVLPITALILLIDRTILGSLNMSDGEVLAKRAGVPGYYPVSRVRKAGLITARIAFSIATMLFIAMVTRTVLFAEDIDRHIDQQDRVVNAKVRTKAEGLIDRQIADAQQELNQAVKERNEVRGLISNTDKPVDTAAVDAEIAAERKSIVDGRARFAELVTAYQEHKRAAGAEAAGVQDKPADSGVQGRGSRHQYHMQQMASIRSQASALREAAQRSLMRIRALEAQRGQEKSTYAQQAEQDRGTLNPRLADADKAVAAAATKRANLVNQRAAKVTAMMKSDPAYVMPSKGLLERVEALDKIQNRSVSAFIVSMALTLMFSILELSAILVRLVQGSPHIAGAEKVNLNLATLDEIYGPRRAKQRRTRANPENALWVSINDNSDKPDEGKDRAA